MILGRGYGAIDRVRAAYRAGQGPSPCRMTSLASVFSPNSKIPVWYLKPGETIFKEGETAKELYVIQSGQVEIQLGNRLLATLEANDIFGEMALLDSAPRSATAIAKTDVALVPISKKDFLTLVGRAPTFALDIMSMMARRLRAANKAI